MFLEDVHQSERSLPGSRRSDKQHIVERAHKLLHQWLERAIITKGFFSEVDPWQPQPEQQSAPVVGSPQHLCYRAAVAGERRVAEVVLQRPSHLDVALLENPRVLLWVAQGDGHLIRLHPDDVCPEEHGMSGTRVIALVIGIRHHHVALPEVGKCGETVGIHPKNNGSDALSGCTLCKLFDSEFIEHIACREFLLCRGIPHRCRSTRLPVGGTHLSQEVFFCHEGKHAEEVFPGEFIGIVERLQSLFQLRFDVFVPKPIVQILQVEGLRSERHEQPLCSALRQIDYYLCYLVANLHRLGKQDGGCPFLDQAIFEFGIEQVGVNLVIGHRVVVVQDGTVEQHLHKVVLLMTVGDEIAFSRLLFDEYPHIGLQQVHTSLQSQHLREERGFEQHLLLFIVANLLELVSHHVAYDALLASRFFMEIIVDVGTHRQFCRIFPEKRQDTAPIGYVILGVVHLLVEHLTGEVTQENRC